MIWRERVGGKWEEGNGWRETGGGKRVAGKSWREHMAGKSWREHMTMMTSCSFYAVCCEFSYVPFNLDVVLSNCLQCLVV